MCICCAAAGIYLALRSCLAYVPQAQCVGRVRLLRMRTGPMGGSVVCRDGYVRMLIGLCLPGAIGWQVAFAESGITEYCLEGQPIMPTNAFPSDAVDTCAD